MIGTWPRGKTVPIESLGVRLKMPSARTQLVNLLMLSRLCCDKSALVAFCTTFFCANTPLAIQAQSNIGLKKLVMILVVKMYFVIFLPQFTVSTSVRG